MWQGSHNQCAKQKESHYQNMKMTSRGFISDTEAIVKESLSLIQHDGAAAFELSERSLLPPALSAKDIPGGPTQFINVRHIRRINCPPVECEDDSAPESISDPDVWRNWNADLDNRNDSKDDCAVDNDSDMDHNNCIENLENLKQQDVRAGPHVPGFVRPI